MDTFLTFTGKNFDPYYVTEKDISSMDIAHALSQICLLNGHLRSFYSLAQHSIALVNEAKSRNYGPRVCLICLLGNAYLAYLPDIPLSLRARLDKYDLMQRQIQETIYDKFNLTEISPEEKKLYEDLDKDVMDNELCALMPGMEKTMPATLNISIDCSEADHRLIERTYSKLLMKLSQIVRQLSDLE